VLPNELFFVVRFSGAIRVDFMCRSNRMAEKTLENQKKSPDCKTHE